MHVITKLWNVDFKEGNKKGANTEEDNQLLSVHISVI